MEIRIAGIVPESVVDGPGIRFVVFVQGCPHGCPGCHNPDTHDFMGGELRRISSLIRQIENRPMITGLTISGGEPFCQAGACGELAREAKALGKDVVVYSGYIFEELKEMAERNRDVRTLLTLADILIDGPYLQEQRDLNLPFRGSANQRIIKNPGCFLSHRVEKHAI
ncbi:MAG: anaerobic ribonucleoside-triphosphate reductase activating protein [Bacillota bacterium]|nr:anaerobic ribonucleoside-triphosphate reductase activating protein [Clostridia bacterium]